MKKILVALLFLWVTKTQAQQITGLWCTSDSTRVYAIQTTGNNNYQAVIIASTRSTDTIGYVAIKNMQYNSRKKRYEGIIYAVADNSPCFVKLYLNKKNTDRLILKLSRMFIMDVSLQWKRVAVTKKV